MLTNGATKSVLGDLDELTEYVGVASRAELARAGAGPARVRANLAARRWQLLGVAIVLHAGPPTTEQRRLAACINCGPRAVLTAFSAAEAYGLTGWSRDVTHVLAPAGVRPPRVTGLPIRLHRTASWARINRHPTRCLHDLAPALVIAGSTFDEPRPACGVLAAAVQQRLVSAKALQDALKQAGRARHRSAMLAAVADIEQGAQALSEIDFIRLCRRYRLPLPVQQAVRVDRAGRRRYLDASWQRGDGRVVVVEVDGALHLSAQRWAEDQLRQNDIALSGALILRFPSVVVRTEPDVVARQLRRALRL